MNTNFSKAAIILMTLLYSCVFTNAQNQLQSDVNYQKQQGKLKAVSLFEKTTSLNRPEYSNFVDEIIYLALPQQDLANLYNQANSGLTLTFPGFDNNDIVLELAKREIFGADFAVYEKEGDRLTEVEVDQHLLYYRGVVRGDDNSLVSLALGHDRLTAIISTDTDGDVTLALDPNDAGFQNNNYLLYRERDRYETRGLDCATTMETMLVNPLALEAASTRSVYNTCKELEIELTVSNRAYTSLGGTTAQATTYIENLMYHVATVFRNENIYTSIGSIIINTTSDTYTESSSLDLLFDFGNEIGPAWNGTTMELAHLVDIAPAGLGGVAWLNVLCNNAYYSSNNGAYVGPFAYSDVYGNAPAVPGGLPNYNWDVAVFSHEMGHNIGSPHTHDCSWSGGAIDNCYTTEGSCAAGSEPGTTRGTIMSYCHICTSSGSCSGGGTCSGIPSCPNPGINLNNGFGPLPGNLLRANVANEFCPSSYIPDGILATSTANANTTITANRECTEGGWTHYYDDKGTIDETDDDWLLSINKGGQNIGSVGDGTFGVIHGLSANAGSVTGATQITAPYATNTNGWYVMNRFWNVTPNPQPVSPVTIRMPYDGADLADILEQVPAVSHTDLFFYKLDNNIDPNPDNNHSGATLSDYNEYVNGASASLTKWAYSTDGAGNHVAEFMVSSFSGGGGGAGGGGNGALPVELISFNGRLQNTAVHLFWETASEEQNDYFLLERSMDGRVFETIAKVNGNGTTNKTQQYTYVDRFPENGTNYYRLTQVDLDGTKHIQGKLVPVDYNKEILMTVHPNPVRSNKLNLAFHSKTSGEMQISILNMQGLLVHEVNLEVTKGENVFEMEPADLKTGLYLLRAVQGEVMGTVKFVVQ